MNHRRKPKGLNKRLEEIKYGTLYMAQRLGTERLLRKVFDKFEKTVPNAVLLSENDIRTLLHRAAVSENAHHELKTAIGYFDQLPKKRLNEKETRNGLMRYAVALGVPPQDLQAIFDKHDELLKKATTEEQRQHIACTGSIEVHRLLHNRQALVMDGNLLIPAEDGVEEENGSSFRKVD